MVISKTIGIQPIVLMVGFVRHTPVPYIVRRMTGRKCMA